jgi:hypothetical protein
VFLGPSSGASGHPPGLSSGFSASYFFSFLVNVIRSSFHLLMKRIKSYLNERKYEIPEFWYQWKMLKNIFSITNQLISTKLVEKFSYEQINLKKTFSQIFV